ncbi:MAG: general secretion pathway protein GspB [Nitrospirae bacterium]|nr:general secretion pathway protein GspB [Nitrospirota bacterium]
MSYILDALKKLEKERRRGLIPGLSEQDSVVDYSQRRAVWPYLLASFLLLGAGVMIAWFVLAPSKERAHRDTAKTVRTVSQDLPKKTDTAAVVLPPAQPVPDVRSEIKTPVIKNDKVQEKPEKVVAGKSDLNKTPVVPVEQTPISSKEQGAVSEPAQTEPKGETPAELPVRDKLYKFSELPPSVRDSLKKFFSITAYMYSSIPAERMVRINDHMMREGQVLDPGIRIEEITVDGVILSYKKFRFFVSVK